MALLPPQGGNDIIIDGEWAKCWETEDQRYQPVHQRLMRKFYPLQKLANQRVLMLDKYRYRALLETPTHKVEVSRDLPLPGPRPKHVSRRALQQRLPTAKYGHF